ncbi:MAG: MFS transporter [Propionibacteriaceae bacterium]
MSAAHRDVVQERPAPAAARIRLLFVGLMLGLLLAELDSTIFATALPTVVGELHGVAHMQWVTTAYVLAGTVVMPVYGKLGDLVGRKPLFIAALVVFVLGSVIGALSPDMGWLIAGRTVQGLGGGGLLILIQAIVADLVPARQRAPYMSVIGAVFAISAMLGPVVGGWLAGGIGWRWALWINLPLGGAAILAAVTLLRLPRPARGRVVVDVWGITALAAGVTSLVLLASWGGTVYPWSSAPVALLATATLVAAVAFVWIERQAAEPILPLHLFTRRNFTAATVASLIMAVALFGSIGYLPTYLQMGQGLSPERAGLVMLSLVAGIGLSTVASAQVVSRTGSYRWLPVLGSGLGLVALLLLSTLTPETDLRLVGGYLFLLGAGLGCAWEILVVMVQNTVSPAEVGTATAANSFFREIGVTLGSAVVGTLFTTRLTALLGEQLPVGSGPVDQLTPESLALLPEAVRATVETAYTAALTPLFGYLVPLLLLSLVVLCLVRPVPLSTTLTPPTVSAEDDADTRELVLETSQPGARRAVDHSRV